MFLGEFPVTKNNKYKHMKNYFQIPLFCIAILFTACNGNGQHTTTSPGQPSGIQNKRESRGTLSFKLNGRSFEADPANAKAWTGKGAPLAILKASNNKGLDVSMQVEDMTGVGTYKLNCDSRGGISITVNGKTYGLHKAMKEDYLNVVITGIKTVGPVLLLSGTFEAVLDDNEGNKVQITEGRFTTESL
jgi:hypothetical protein